MFGTSRSSQRVIAVADIGTDSAAVALVAIKAGEPARIVVAERIMLPFEERTEDAAAKGVLASLDQAAQKVLAAQAAGEYKDSRISAVYAIIGAPWTTSKTLRASSTFQKETRITNGMVGNLAQKAIGDDKETDRSNLIESAVIRVELNRYPTSLPIGKFAHLLSIAVMASECDARIKKGVEDALGRAFPGTKPVFRSGARALLYVLRALPKSTEDYVILDVQGENSTIIAVRGGLACEQASLPEGIRSIIRRVAEKSLPEETLSLIRMLERDECTSEACDAISAAMGKAEIDLSKIFGDSLTKISVQARLPADLVLVTHPDLSSWLSRFFARIDFTQCTLTMQPFSVHALTSENVETLVIPETSAAMLDIGLLISGALVNIEENA